MEHGLKRVLHGRTFFVSDMYAKGMLYVHTIRSTVAAGRIVAIGRSQIPEDILVITASDIPGENAVSVGEDSMPVLADGLVNYYGEPIALLIGPDLDRLIRLGAGLEVEFDEVGAATDHKKPRDDQVYKTQTREWGDYTKATKAAARVVVGEYNTGAQAHLYSEPQGAFVVHEENELVIYSPTQWPHHVQRTVARVTGLPSKRVRVKKGEVAMTLDGKLIVPSLVASHAALAAELTGAPIKLMYSRQEDFLYTPKRAPVCVRHETSLDNDGNLLAMKVDIDMNIGAYPLFCDEILTRLCVAATGVYRCENVVVRARAIRTNLPPLGPMSGFGSASGLFAIETHMARIAQVLDTTPAEFKLRSLAPEQTFTVASRAKKDHSLVAVAHILEESSDFARKFAAYELARKNRDGFTVSGDMLPRGIGIAFAYQGSGFVGNREAGTGYGVTMRLDTSGIAEIRTSAVATTPTTTTMWREVAAGILGISPDNVFLHEIDTHMVPDSGPSTLSRNIAIINKLIESCANSIKKQRFRKPLPIDVRRTVQLPRSLTWDERNLSGTPYSMVSWGGVAVEVEADPVSFLTRVRGIWIALDPGRIVDRRQLLRTIETATTVALGWASSESLDYADGKLSADQYETYHVLGIGDRPPLQVTFLPGEKSTDPKGVGELVAGCVPAAYSLALSQASGRYIDAIPATPELVHAYTEEA